MDPFLRIKNDIVRCLLRPGEIVNEGELAERYEIGRSVVREALQALRYQGFVEARPRVGYVVLPVTVKDVLDLFGLRAIVEPAASALAAQEASEEEKQSIERMAEHDATAVHDDFVALHQGNSGFHCAVAQASHNAALASVQEYIMERFERILNLGVGRAGVLDRMARQHKAIARAIYSGDVEKAYSVALDQVEESKQNLIESVFQGELAGELGLGFLPPAATGTGWPVGGLTSRDVG
jgi:DNA-binding GntR family transcriptional regulator